MLADLILGIAAGAGASWAEPKVKQALEGMLLSDAPLTGQELKFASFAVCVVGAALLAHVFGEGEALAVAIGALIGVFGPRIVDMVQRRRNPDYDSNFDKE